MEPFNPQTFVYKLKGKKGEEGKFGELRLRLVFKPDYVTRTRQGSSTFHGTFAAPGKLVTGVAGAPLKVGGFAVGGITKGASFLKKNAFGRGKSSAGQDEDPMIVEPEMERTTTNQTNKRPTSSGSAIRDTDDTDERLLSTPNRNGGGGGGSSSSGGGLSPISPPHQRSRSTSSQRSVPGVIGGGAESGTATVRLLSASGFLPGANLQVRIRALDKSKDLLKSKAAKSSSGDVQFDESFTVQCLANQQFRIFVKDNHVFKDVDLGEGLFVVDDTGSGQETVVSVGEGRVTLKTSFKNSDAASNESPKTARRGLLKRG